MRRSRTGAVLLSLCALIFSPLPACAPAAPVTDEIESPVEPLTEKADRILVEKANRTLTLLRDDRELRRYRVALGASPEGDKHCEGDRRTPEGRYHIAGRNPNSAYHLSLRISYPNAEDREQAAREGCPPGGDIMIHGLPPKWDWIGKKHALSDWTLGCVAVSNAEIDEIWNAVADGTPIEIRP